MSLTSAVLFASVAWLLQLTGMNIHDWIEGELANGHKYREGLWKYCEEEQPCEHFTLAQRKAWHRVCQTLAILAVSAMFGSVIAGLLVCFKGKMRRCIIIAAVLALLGGMISLTCLLYCAANVVGYAVSYGVGFKLCAVASCLSFAAFGFYFSIQSYSDLEKK